MNTEKQVRLSNCLGVLLVPFVVLALASQSAMALPLTFAWDAGQNWPSGTTIELEANGATANAIAATQYTINVPVQPGEVINARVRAIPPTGYECGDPLALCPPSDWTTLAQTLPAVPTGVWGRIEPSGEHVMAVAYLGSQAIGASSGSINQTITVPANTDYAIIFFGGWSATVRTVSAASIGGTAATNLYTRAVSNYSQDHYIYGVATSSGSKNFTLTMSGSFNEGGVAMLVFLSGVDASNPLVANAYFETEAVSASTWSQSITSVSDGMALVFVTGYDYSDSFIPTAQSQTTAISNAGYNSDIYAAGYKTTTGTSVTVGIDRSISGQYFSVDGITLRPASGGAATVSPNDMQHAQSMDAATLLQAHILAVAEMLHSQAIDNATLTQAFTLTPNDAINTQSIDATTLLQQSVISPADLIHGNTLDSTALIQAHTLAIAELLHAQTIDNLALVVAGDITPDEMMTAQAVDAPLLLQAHIISPNDALNAQSIESPVIVQSNVLIPAGMDHAVILDSPVIVQANVISPSELLTAQAVDNAILAVLGSLTVADVLTAQAIEAPGLTQAHTIAPNELIHVNSIDATELFQGFILVPADLLHEQAMEGALLDVIFGLSPADLLNAQGIESPGLIQAHVIFPADLLQANRFDVAGISSGLLQVPTGRAIVLGASDRYVLLTPADRFILLTKSTRAVS